MNSWLGGWLALRVVWHLIMQAAGPIALLWFGLFFPERSRIDRRFPFLKWIISFSLLACLTVSLWIDYGWWYDKTAAPWRSWINPINNRVFMTLTLCCLGIHALAVIDKLRSASTADARHGD